jgi:hypothetical protein
MIGVLGGVRAAPSSGAMARPVESQGGRQKNRQFLDKPADAQLLFFGINRSRSRASSARAIWSGRDSQRNENEVKPLKTNNAAKSPISHP